MRPSPALTGLEISFELLANLSYVFTVFPHPSPLLEYFTILRKQLQFLLAHPLGSQPKPLQETWAEVVAAGTQAQHHFLLTLFLGLSFQKYQGESFLP